MIGAGCGIGEHNLSQHSVKWCEKSGLAEVGGPNLPVHRWQVSQAFAGSDASRVDTPVRSDVVDLSARGADIHQLRVA